MQRVMARRKKKSNNLPVFITSIRLNVLLHNKAGSYLSFKLWPFALCIWGGFTIHSIVYTSFQCQLPKPFGLRSPTSSERQSPQFVTSCPAVDWRGPPLVQKENHKLGKPNGFFPLPFCGNVCPRRQCSHSGRGGLPGGYLYTPLHPLNPSQGMEPYSELSTLKRSTIELREGGRIESLSSNNHTVSARTVTG